MTDLLDPNPSTGAAQTWRDLVALAADFAFETDEWGRFVLISPDPALGWAAGALIGQPAAMLLAEGNGFNPFQITAAVRHRRVSLQCAGGGIANLVFAAAPVLDAMGRVGGVRGLGIELTGLDGNADAVRRGEVLDHILGRMGGEVRIARMMATALETLTGAMGAEGAGVLLLPSDGILPHLAHQTGSGADLVLETASRFLLTDVPRPGQTMTPEGRPVVMAVCQTRAGERAGLAIWRAPGARDWASGDRQLAASTVNIVRMVLEHEAIQHEMTRQARTDSLTGLLNRRAFLEEVDRHAARLDREGASGTLMFADLDYFKPVNDRLGHEVGDKVLIATAALLRRAVRPTDLVARLGGDEFAVWLNGADHMTAAERAEFLREAAPRELGEVVGPDGPRLSMSIGIASRRHGESEPLDSLIRRADMAMYEVKRGGRGHWRVSLKAAPA